MFRSLRVPHIEVNKPHHSTTNQSYQHDQLKCICMYTCVLLNPFNSLHCTQILMEEAVISCLFKNYRGHSIVVSLACLSTQTAFRTVCDPVYWWQLTEDGNVFWFSHTVPPENSWQDPWISSRHWHIVYRKNNFFPLVSHFKTLMASTYF